MTEQDYATVGRNADGSPMLQTRILAFVGKLLNIQFHIGGFPYGAAWATSINGGAEGPNDESGAQ